MKIFIMNWLLQQMVLDIVLKIESIESVLKKWINKA